MLLVYFNLYVVSLLDSTRERRKNGVIKIFIAVVFWLSLSLLILYNNNNTDQESIIVATVTPGNLLPSACGGRKEIVHVGGRLPCNGSVHRMLNLTESAAINSGAKLIVWPEAWLSGFNDQQSLQLFLDKEIAPVVKRLGVILTFGATVKPCENLAVTIDNGGSIVSVYGKQCPFWIAGEKSSAKYGFPVFELPSVLSSSRPELSVTNTLGKASTLICYDMDFPATVRTVAGLGASIIVNPSNDWSSMRNHYGVSVFRAIENNIPIVKADGAWDSAIIDGSGKILTEFQSIEAIEKVLVAKVNLKGMSTIATLLGDLIPLLCCSYVVVIIMIICGRTLSGLLQSWKERRRSRSLYAPILDGETP
ncbi:conserved hypothetical protein [Perkinsus marinus ATCC 50983]|uniref:CN hydrolase domain-containing protein n=1 Tax=Perkinsus marinus (strain ATCC 50983 / TXsc) TaxID=423536 RepID=C5LRB9_PERM5|nr:conserved hypothetical protein [Perkinsus marinus ATCC 50983]EER00723.1 conserved hypothetical protein [Perkinsus marinus ATCC 50983]|eukprot:XP_002768005.1 conserved hypothetical protein [Perkinsus marinus ATCC 50983]